VGTATYIVLNLVFLVLASITALLWLRRNRKHFAIVCLHLVFITALFDSLAIHYGIFSYDHSKIIGTYIFKAPVEDFAYAIGAALLVPSIWHILGKRKKGSS